MGKSVLLFLAGATAVAGGVALTLREIELAPTVAGLIVLGLLLIVLPHLPPIKLGFGKDGLTFETLQDQVHELQQQAAGERVSRSMLEKLSMPVAEAAPLATGETQDDKLAGQFGGRSEANGRRLNASVERIASTDFARVRVWVSATAGAAPLAGEVTFHLHETFRPEDVQTVPVNAEGVAMINFSSYGAFTVGAKADGGRTSLELDLKEAPGAFEPWKSK